VGGSAKEGRKKSLRAGQTHSKSQSIYLLDSTSILDRLLDELGSFTSDLLSTKDLGKRVGSEASEVGHGCLKVRDVVVVGETWEKVSPMKKCLDWSRTQAVSRSQNRKSSLHKVPLPQEKLKKMIEIPGKSREQSLGAQELGELLVSTDGERTKDSMVELVAIEDHSQGKEDLPLLDLPPPRFPPQQEQKWIFGN